jgi:hypothetical protein
LNSLSTLPAELRPWKRSVNGVLKQAISSVLAVVLCSCAAIAPRSAETIVRERAQARWDALVKNDFNAAYGYLSPGSRSVITAPDYAASLRQGFWKAATVEKVECGSAQLCEVTATIEYEHMGRRTKTPLRESWIRDGSEWWYLQK